MNLFHITKTENIPYIKSEGLKPFIGINSSSYGETKPAIYFFMNKETMEDALVNWMGDLFEEDEQLSVITVDVKEHLIHKSSASYECCVFNNISYHNIIGIEAII